MNQCYKLLTTACLVVFSFAVKAQCDTVSAINSVSIGATNILISWPQVSNGIDYEYAVRLDNSVPNAGTITSQTSAQIMGIPADKIVYICIRTRCGSGLSEWKCSNFKTAPAGTGINSISETKTTVYPNPVTDILNFSFADNKSHYITIVNSIGAIVGNYTLPADISSINLNYLNTGLYFVKIASENEAQTFKIDKR